MKQHEHPTKEALESPTDEKEISFEYQILKQWENVGFSNEDDSRDCYMSGAKYAKALLEADNLKLLSNVKVLREALNIVLNGYIACGKALTGLDNIETDFVLIAKSVLEQTK